MSTSLEFYTLKIPPTRFLNSDKLWGAACRPALGDRVAITLSPASYSAFWRWCCVALLVPEARDANSLQVPASAVTLARAKHCPMPAVVSVHAKGAWGCVWGGGEGRSGAPSRCSYWSCWHLSSLFSSFLFKIPSYRSWCLALATGQTHRH